MRNIQQETTRTISALILLSASLIMGCIIVPTPVTPHIETDEEVHLSDYTMVTVGPRKLLENIGERITDSRTGIEVVDGLAFRDSAFPEGGWLAKDLLQPAAAKRVAEELDVDYLVLISVEVIEEYGDEHNYLIPVLGGVMSGQEKSALSAIVIDLRQASLLPRIRVEASAKWRGAIWVIYGVGTDPMTEAAVLEGISDAITSTLSEHAGRDDIRIALLAAEAV